MDLLDLLNTLAGYLPHSYLTDKIVKDTKGWKDVWDIIYEHYGVKVTNETFLDFESINKQLDETHRQFYERLLQHVRQHLAPAGATAKPLTAQTADQMSIILMNMVALQWLRKTNKDLIDLVKLEYSTELQGGTQLVALVPKIATNIDSLLTRHATATTNNVKTVIMEDNAVDNAEVNRTWSSGPPYQRRSSTGRGRAQTSRGGLARGTPTRGVQSQDRKATGPFCPSCYYLGQQLDTIVHYRHVPLVCPKKAVAVKMLQMEDNEHFIDDDEESVSVGKVTTQHNDVTEIIPLQAPLKPEQSSPATLNVNINKMF